jgi:hypothetical protein
MNLLAAFQAYLVYAMIIFFSLNETESFIDRQMMTDLQDFACEVSSLGLVCPEELSHKRPPWESWIVASTKRRTLYTMYMFDSVFCAHDALPNFLAKELESLPAPSSKVLWEASEKDIWEDEYNLYLSEWADGGLKIDELWPVPDNELVERRKRINRWLKSVDEYGMMLFAVTLGTHGG